jgi:hypothetical protein
MAGSCRRSGAGRPRQARSPGTGPDGIPARPPAARLLGCFHGEIGPTWAGYECFIFSDYKGSSLNSVGLGGSSAFSPFESPRLRSQGEGLSNGENARLRGCGAPKMPAWNPTPSSRSP